MKVWEIELTEFLNIVIAHLNQVEEDVFVLKNQMKNKRKAIIKLNRRIAKLEKEAIWKN